MIHLGTIALIQSLTLFLGASSLHFFLSSFDLIGFSGVSFLSVDPDGPDEPETGRSFAVRVGATTGGLINLKTSV